MNTCSACNRLKENTPNFVVNGLTDDDCNSLNRNNGLAHQQLRPTLNNCETLQDLVDCLIGQHADRIAGYNLCDIKDWLAGLSANLHQLMSAWVCNECGQWREIDEINNRLDEVEDALRALLTGRRTLLQEGRDYEIVYLNGFMPMDPVRGIDVWAVTTPFSTEMQVRSNSASGTINALEHPTAGDIVRISSQSAAGTTPSSWMYAISFRGNYASLNNRGTTNSVRGTGTWDINPRSVGASWGVGIWHVSTGALPASVTGRRADGTTTTLSNPRIIIAPTNPINGLFGSGDRVFGDYPTVTNAPRIRTLADFFWMNN